MMLNKIGKLKFIINESFGEIFVWEEHCSKKLNTSIIGTLRFGDTILSLKDGDGETLVLTKFGPGWVDSFWWNECAGKMK